MELNKQVKTPYQRVKEWRDRNKVKRKAQMLVYSAIRNKTLKSKPCLVCGNKKTEAHHRDYNRPLWVQWLCKEHHIIADKKLRNKK